MEETIALLGNLGFYALAFISFELPFSPFPLSAMMMMRRVASERVVQDKFESCPGVYAARLPILEARGPRMH